MIFGERGYIFEKKCIYFFKPEYMMTGVLKITNEILLNNFLMRMAYLWNQNPQFCGCCF